MHPQKTILVLGASSEPDRISGLAVSRLSNEGYLVLAVGRSGGKIGDVIIHPSISEIQAGPVHTVTMYLNAKNQADYYPWIFANKPKRIIFNPGAENPELEALASIRGIECENACTLVLLSSGVF